MESALGKSSRVPQIRIDRGGSVLELNQAAAEVLGVTPSEILARPASLLPEPWGPLLSRPDVGTLRWKQEADGTWRVQLRHPPSPAQMEDLREALGHAEGREAQEILVQSVSAVLNGDPGGFWVHDQGILLPWVVEGGIPATAMAASDVWAVRLGRKLVHGGIVSLDPLPIWKTDEEIEVLPLYAGSELVGMLVGPSGAWSEGLGPKVAADARRVASQI
jgi:hypothetical protein